MQGFKITKGTGVLPREINKNGKRTISSEGRQMNFALNVKQGLVRQQ